jgi:cytochrome c oxidase subunit III
VTDYAAVPRTTEATDAAAVTRVVSQRVSKPAAWWGMIILIASEATLFGALVGTYYYLRFNTVVWPPDGLPKPDLVAPLILLGVLVLSSLPMQIASRAARAGRLARTRLAIVAALVLQCAYFVYEIHDFRDQLHRFDITRDAYSSIYYTLLGADHAHVLLGILFNFWLLWKLVRGLTTYRVNAVQAVTWYWHAVNILTVVVIGTLLSARA